MTWQGNRGVTYPEVVTDSPDTVKNTIVKDGVHEKELELALCEFTEASHDHLVLYVFRPCLPIKLIQCELNLGSDSM